MFLLAMPSLEISFRGATYPEVYSGLTEKGTLFCYNMIDSTIVIRFLENLVVLGLPGEIFRVGRVENFLFLHTKDSQLYKVTFDDYTKFVGIMFMRNIAQNEYYDVEGLLGTTIGKKKYLYRLSETPENDAIHVDAADEELTDANPAGVHRGKLIYCKKTDCYPPKAKRVGSNVVIVEHHKYLANARSAGGRKTAFFSDDSLPYILLLTLEGKLLAVDMDTLEVTVVELKIKKESDETFKERFSDIVGIYNGLLSVEVQMEFEGNDIQYFILTAQLPANFPNVDVPCTCPSNPMKFIPFVAQSEGKTVVIKGNAIVPARKDGSNEHIVITKEDEKVEKVVDVEDAEERIRSIDEANVKEERRIRELAEENEKLKEKLKEMEERMKSL
ncbi:hypothetical protein PFISCL1PPCAC_7071 [Pristionchus fissidentatus]|uniref:Uncharacterized protein n=1 Tax=Pristionchus fissidentatus TaxID=1538716 RepID=A0AAV5VD04_9BILA|nr:hypothetical protein PFISCL1PPCAC_7071 [Pristionchus fissidentatus]